MAKKEVKETPEDGAPSLIEVEALKPFNTTLWGNFEVGQKKEIDSEVADQLREQEFVK
jgi:hypothetical protein